MKSRQELLGEELLARHKRTANVPFHEICDHMRDEDVVYTVEMRFADVIGKQPQPQPTLAQETKEVYISELVHRFMQGDPYAKSMLDHYYEHGTFNGAPSEPVD